MGKSQLIGTTKIDGITEVMDALKELDIKTKVQLFESFFRKAANKLVIPQLRARMNYSARTEKNIKIQPSKGEFAGIFVGPTTDSYPLRFADRGTAMRQTKKGAGRGMIIGRNEIEPTIDGQIDPLVDFIQNELDDEISKILEKKLKRQNKKLGL